MKTKYVVAALIAWAQSGTALAADAVPCSKRYAHQIKYELSESGIGSDPARALAGWGLTGKAWGFDRLQIRRHEQSQRPALSVFYPKGSINPSNENAPQGGASFYARGGFAGERAACLQYQVYFPADFEFAKGGKLPGLYGGKDASGCRKGVSEDGFSLRYMWREDGAGSLYAYLPGKSEECGKYIGKGTWHFRRGAWTTIEQEAVLNTPGKNDGLVRVWVDGRLVIEEPRMMLRMKDSIAIDGIFFVSFFGGKKPEWASPRDQRADFASVTVSFP
jgi:hypothetical protein